MSSLYYKVFHSSFFCCAQRTIEAAMRARLAGVTILAVGVGGWTNKAELNQIASDPDNKNVYHVDNFNNLAEKSFFKKIKSAVCNGKAMRNPCTTVFGILNCEH